MEKAKVKQFFCNISGMYRVMFVLLVVVIGLGINKRFAEQMDVLNFIRNKEPDVVRETVYVPQEVPVQEEPIKEEPPHEVSDFKADYELENDSFAFLPYTESLLESIGDIAGTVTRVIDGDTIIVKSSRGDYKVRLIGIDAPESNQDFGKEAKTKLEELVLGKTVIVRNHGADRYDRMLGIVTVDGSDINAAMVRQGCAWSCHQFTKEVNYDADQDMAKEISAGIWKNDSPVPPWLFRSLAKTSSYCKACVGKGLYIQKTKDSTLLHNANCKAVTNRQYYGTKVYKWDGVSHYINCPSCGGCFIDAIN